MPPQRFFRDRPSRRNVKEKEGVPNACEVQPLRQVTNVEFRETIRIMSLIVTKTIW